MGEVAKALIITVNLTLKEMVKAKLDDVEVTASDVLTMMVFHNMSASHVKIHAYANWAVNCEANLKAQNLHPFIHQNSVVTVLYNFFGKSLFPQLVQMFQEWGITDDDWTNIK